MAKIYAMYRKPTDPAAFERYYFDKHVRLAATGGVDILIADTELV